VSVEPCNGFNIASFDASWLGHLRNLARGDAAKNASRATIYLLRVWFPSLRSGQRNPRSVELIALRGLRASASSALSPASLQLRMKASALDPLTALRQAFAGEPQ
jgi:hypothetical protein